MGFWGFLGLFGFGRRLVGVFWSDPIRHLKLRFKFKDFPHSVIFVLNMSLDDMLYDENADILNVLSQILDYSRRAPEEAADTCFQMLSALFEQYRGDMPNAYRIAFLEEMGRQLEIETRRTRLQLEATQALLPPRPPPLRT